MTVEALNSPDAEIELALRVSGEVPDPEIPAVTLDDLGVIRGAERRDGRVVVKVSPTYTGCPATQAIRLMVETALLDAGLADARVETVLSPAWSTDDITERGRMRLKEFGIAPPVAGAGRGALFGSVTVACPRCNSTATEKISEFGSTACKSLWRCTSCKEPFDYFKCL